MKKLTLKKCEAAIKRIRTSFSGQTFSSKEHVAEWMRERSIELEKEGWKPGDIFYILKSVIEKK